MIITAAVCVVISTSHTDAMHAVNRSLPVINVLQLSAFSGPYQPAPDAGRGEQSHSANISSLNIVHRLPGNFAKQVARRQLFAPCSNVILTYMCHKFISLSLSDPEEEH